MPPCSGQGYEFQYTDARGPTFRDDFSLLKCTRPRPRVRRRNLLMEACTVAVEDQVEETAAAAQGPNGTRVCARCGGGFKVEVLYTGWPLRYVVLVQGGRGRGDLCAVSGCAWPAASAQVWLCLPASCMKQCLTLCPLHPPGPCPV